MEAMLDDVEWRVQYLLGEPISGNGLLKERAAKHFIQWEDAGSRRHRFAVEAKFCVFRTVPTQV